MGTRSSWTTCRISRPLAPNQRWARSQGTNASDGALFDAIADGTPDRPFEPEPVEPLRTETQEVRRGLNGGEPRAAEQLHGRGAPEPGQVQLHGLRTIREVGHHEDDVVAVLAEEGEDGVVARTQELDGATP